MVLNSSIEQLFIFLMV